MADASETFFTVIGCMDGRVQDVMAQYGRQKFGSKFPDTLTEAGIVKLLAGNPSDGFLENFKAKVLISIEKHHSTGILVGGHAECAGDPVDRTTAQEHIRKSVAFIKTLVPLSVPVLGVYVGRAKEDPARWQVLQEVS